MLYLNFISLMAISFMVGYIIGKGKIVFEKKVEPTPEQKKQFDELIQEQKRAIESYNESIRNLTNY